MSRIADLRLGHVRYDRGRPTLRWGSHRFPRSALVAEVTDNEGRKGVALVWCRVPDGQAFARSTIGILKEAVSGKDTRIPYNVGQACQDAALRPGIVRAASLVELALWDLAGHVLNVPCYQLLGCKRRALPSYAISTEEFGFTEKSQYVDMVQSFAARGFRACKFHLLGDASRDIAICEAVRAAVGDAFTLMLDPAGRYDRASALRVACAIERLGFERIEDPISPKDFLGYRWLSSRVSLTLAANDALLWNLRDCAEAAREGFVQCLRIDPGRAGMVACLATTAIAEIHHIEIDFAALAPYGGVEACLHLGLGAKTARWFEKHFASGIDEVPGVTTGISIIDGDAFPSDYPGWGIQIADDEFNRHCDWVSR